MEQDQRVLKRAASRDFYRAYLNTPDWRMRRNRALKLAGYRCGRCDSKRGLQVHHLTYERLSREWDSDLEVLCDVCHRGEHLEHPDQTSLGVYLKLASEVVTESPFASIADLSDRLKRRCAALKIPVVADQVHAALAVVCGNRLKTSPAQTVREVIDVDGRPLTRAEAFECLCRLDWIGLIRQMPSAPSSRIDIYARIHEEKVEHDRY